VKQDAATTTTET